MQCLKIRNHTAAKSQRLAYLLVPRMPDSMEILHPLELQTGPTQY